MVETKVPRSVASRRDAARPAKHNDGRDVTLILPWDAESLMSTAIPMNETPKQKDDKTDYIGSGLRKVGLVKKTFLAQNTSFKDYEMIECYDTERDQTIYVDINGGLPSLTTKRDKNGKLIRTSWNHAHYYLIGEILTKAEVEAAMEFCTEYNETYLPVILLWMCRMKGKDAEEASKEDKLQQAMDDFGDDDILLNSVTRFELFFERYIVKIVRNLKDLNIEDLVRLIWAVWNIWNTRHERVYNNNDKSARSGTRAIAGNNLEKEKLDNNSLVHYMTILLHTQGM